jgi:type I restriction enzyme R subunit
MLVDGVTVEYRRPDGSIAGDQARVLDYEHPERNDWLAVDQFTVVEKAPGGGSYTRRADIVLFVNGLPLAVLELKNAADENATLTGAFNQLRTYRRQIPGLFNANAALALSDGVTARMGALTSDRQRFMPWRTVE